MTKQKWRSIFCTFDRSTSRLTRLNSVTCVLTWAFLFLILWHPNQISAFALDKWDARQLTSHTSLLDKHTLKTKAKKNQMRKRARRFVLLRDWSAYQLLSEYWLMLFLLYRLWCSAREFTSSAHKVFPSLNLVPEGCTWFHFGDKSAMKVKVGEECRMKPLNRNSAFWGMTARLRISGNNPGEDRANKMGFAMTRVD